MAMPMTNYRLEHKTSMHKVGNIDISSIFPKYTAKVEISQKVEKNERFEKKNMLLNNY